MDSTAVKAMMAEIAPVIREYVAASQAPLLERVATLEADKVELTARCVAVEQAAQSIPESLREESEREAAKMLAAVAKGLA